VTGDLKSYVSIAQDQEIARFGQAFVYFHNNMGCYHRSFDKVSIEGEKKTLHKVCKVFFTCMVWLVLLAFRKYVGSFQWLRNKISIRQL